MMFRRLLNRRRRSPELAAAMARHPSAGGRHLRPVSASAPRVTWPTRVRTWIVERVFGLKDWQLGALLLALALPGIALIGVLIGAYIMGALKP